MYNLILEKTESGNYKMTWEEDSGVDILPGTICFDCWKLYYDEKCPECGTTKLERQIKI